MPGKRLLFVLYELSFGGVERQAQLLAEAGHVLGHSITLLILGSDGPAYERFVPCCKKIIILKSNIHRDRVLIRDIRQSLPQSQFDAAFLFSTAKLPVISHALKAVAPVQLMHVGNPVSWNWNEYLKQMARTAFYPPSPQLKLVANSNYTLQSLQQHAFYRQFPLALSLNSVHIPDEPAVVREECDTLRIGMVARLDRIKDQATLIRAMAVLRDKGVKADCELVGGGELETTLKALAKELGVMDTVVRFAGWVADVPQRLRSYDVFVFSTTAREGFGNAAAEAMAMGLPCIFTDIGPCREVGGEAVEYVPPSDAQALADKIMALQSHALRERLATLARERSLQHFRPERNFLDYLHLLPPETTR
jgi:glycosyltransferase involved in cell wall biosynthesis